MIEPATRPEISLAETSRTDEDIELCKVRCTATKFHVYCDEAGNSVRLSR